jgi:phosphoglycolate phosphatase
VIRNIIFDWSGTLVDDLPAVWKATNFVLTQAERQELTLEQFRAEFCLPFTKFYDRFVPHIPLPQLEEWFHAQFRAAQDSVIELPHAREFLDFCAARKIRMFLLSTVHENHFAVQAATTGFDRYLEKPYLGVIDKRLKIKSILEENNLVPQETLFVGDMQHDIETAKHGGVFSCAVLTGYNSLEQLRVAEPDVIVENLSELRQVLDRSNFELEPATAKLENGPVVTVGALIFNDAGEVLMVRTDKWSGLWGIPGGKVKWGEPSVDALKREIKEETHLDVCDVRFVLVQDCIHSKEFYRDAHFVLLNYTAQVVGTDGVPAVKLNNEAREFKWLTPQAALKLNLNQPTRTLIEKVKELAMSDQ